MGFKPASQRFAFLSPQISRTGRNSLDKSFRWFRKTETRYEIPDDSDVPDVEVSEPESTDKSSKPRNARVQVQGPVDSDSQSLRGISPNSPEKISGDKLSRGCA